MIFNLVFFQGYPLAVVLAENTSTSSSSDTQTSSSQDTSSGSSDAQKTDAKNNDTNDDTSNSSDKKDKADSSNDVKDSSANDSTNQPDKAASGEAAASSDVASAPTSSENVSSQKTDPSADSTDSTGETTPNDNTNDTNLSTPTELATTPENDPTSSSNPPADSNATAKDLVTAKDATSTTANTPSAPPATTFLAPNVDVASPDTISGDSNDPALLNTSVSAPTDTSTDTTGAAVTNTNDTVLDNTAVTMSDTGGNTTVDATDQTSTSTNQANATTSGKDESQAVPTSSATSTTTPISTSTDASQGSDATDTTTPTPVADTTINTGDASATTVIKNDINTNVTTSNGTVSNADIYDYTGDINLLEAFQTVLDNAKKKTDSNEEAINLAIKNINNAVVTNNATTTAETGKNSASGDGASVETGEASALTDIVNYINTNIVGNNWLYATLNIFGNWNGNLIVPGEGLLNVPTSNLPSNLNIVNSNSATVANDVTTTASTDDNTVNSLAGGVSIQTGTAVAGTNVANVLNTNIVQNNWFLLLFNNMGNWSGQLLNWGGENNNVLTYNLSSLSSYASAASPTLGSLSVINQNNADVSNNATTTADTGGNTASGDGANVTTGKATAISNIFNMINTNIVGDNWFFGVVNNMGNWNGNVEFAYPDLAIGLEDSSGTVAPGGDVTYTIHYKNFGRAAAGVTHLTLKLPAGISADKNSWDLSSLKPDQEGSLDVQAKVSSDAPVGEKLVATAKISTDTKEVNLDNNSATDELNIYDAQLASSGNDDKLYSKITVKRSSTAGVEAKPGDHVKNTLIVENKSDNTLYDVYVSDKLLTTDGAKLGNFSWPIGKMKKGGKVMIQYEFIVNNPGQKMTVNYVARAAGQDVAGKDVNSHKASALLTVLGFAPTANAQTISEAPVVAGAETQNSASAQVLGDMNSPINKLPLWIWLAAAIAFFLTINWSLFPKRR